MRGWDEYSATNRQHWYHNLVIPAPPARTLESRSPDLWQRTPVTQVMTVAFSCSRWQDFAFPCDPGRRAILTAAMLRGMAPFRCLDQGLWSLDQLGQHP